MLKLHGFAVSNYYNMVKLALLEKGVAFEEVPMIPGKTPDLLQRSPRGKVPALETPDGFISETCVILDYIEETHPEHSLLPKDAYQRARVRSLAREIELYIELPARSCFGAAFFGKEIDEVSRERARGELQAGLAALERHASFAPFVAGSEFTLADIYFLFAIEPALGVGEKVFGVDLLASLPKARELLEKLQAMPHVKRIAQDKDALMPQFLEMMRAKR